MSDMRTIGQMGPVTSNMEDAALPPVRSEPLLVIYERFKHLDLVLRGCEDSDDPIYRTCAALWIAVAETQTADMAMTVKKEE